MKIQALLDKNIPFSVVKHYVSFRGNKNDRLSKYELLFVNSKNEINLKLLDKQEICFLKENIKLINTVINNEDGRVYEFNKFKEYKEALNVEFKF